MTAFDLFSIGHSNIPAERFIALQHEAGVKTIADVRSTPFSRFCPWFSAKNLAPLLAKAGIAYSFYGAELGGRPSDAALNRDGVADFEAMARQPDFHAGLDRLVAEAARSPTCMMCSEREPLECHRCLLLARALAARGLNVGHILHDGTIEPHAVTEQRLVALDSEGDSLFVTGQQERLAAAYLRQARAVAYRGKGRDKAGKTGLSGAKKEIRNQEKLMRPLHLLSVFLSAAAAAVVVMGGGQALAQVNADPTPAGTMHPVPLPPLADPNSPTVAAKDLFARKPEPTPGPARSIGGYADGCLAGGVALPITGPNWQVMRLSRNRNWGNPLLITFLERFAAHAKSEWNGLLVGDMSQPRGGPMISGHASHQVGLDADIWFTPMPDHVLSGEEREMNGATNIVAPDGLGVDPKIWIHNYLELIRTASLDPATTRIFVNPAIKKQMCSEAGSDRAWLTKVRPWWGHAEHFHVRIACPADSAECKAQKPPDPGDGCGAEVKSWLKDVTRPKPPSTTPKPPHPPMTLAGLPPACKQVVQAP